MERYIILSDSLSCYMEIQKDVRLYKVWGFPLNA